MLITIILMISNLSHYIMDTKASLDFSGAEQAKNILFKYGAP